MGHVAGRIVTVSLAAAGLCLVAAGSASASPASSFQCGTDVLYGPGGPLVSGEICVWIDNGQVSGQDSSVYTYIYTWITQCNAAQTVCSMIPSTEVSSPVTPSVSTTPGEYYEACSTVILNYDGVQAIGGGCSPLVPA
jgi:hypothetical protein